MVWTKGPRCGIDNCASQFYRVISGHRVCQNNHVQEGLETTADDDDFVAVGQRIRRPRERKSKSAFTKREYKQTTLRGIEAKQLVWEFMQTVYQQQIKFVKATCHFTDEFDLNCRELWACFFSLYRSQRFTLSHLVCLIYLATRRSNDPVLLGDFNLWIRASRFPYLETYRYLPAERFRKLPSDLRKHFMPSAGPGKMKLHEQTLSIKSRLSKHFRHLRFHDIDPRYVCYRLCRDLFFPPAVYEASLKLLLHLSHSPDQARAHAATYCEEIPALCATVVAIKLYSGLDSSGREVPIDKSRLDFNWGVWKDVMTKIWILNPDMGRADERLAHIWSGNQIDDYLAWYSEHLSSSNLEKRVKNMFPVPQIQSEPEDSFPTPEVLSELCEIVYSTRLPPTGKSGKSGKSQSDSEFKRGSAYEIFTAHSENMPAEILLLYEIIERFLNIDSDQWRTIIRAYEARVRRHFSKVLAAPARNRAKT